jgi:3-hydroxyacyl-[acyl-carrier-protein] dehydratase
MTVAIVERLFALDTRCAEGHFPGNPIIPGAVLLSETLTEIAAKLGVVLPPCDIKAAKFFHPVHPGDRVAIEYGAAGPGEIKFTCTVEGKSVLAGIVACEALAKPA